MLWGLSGDPPFDAVRRELARRDVPHVVLDQRSARPPRLDVSTADGITGRLTLEHHVVDIEDIGAIFVRPYDIRQALPGSADMSADAAAKRTAVAVEQQLFAWTDIADARVLNRPSAMASNASKPYQSELIRQGGFATPCTLVTTTPDVAREFIARHGQVIYKSVSDVRSMVTRADESELEGIDDVSHCPTQFQAYVAGTDWRVHVVGDETYACEIQCVADDYRYAAPQGIAIDVRAAVLPAAIEARCHALAHALNLPLAGIDLRRTDDDRWYCFEVNPSPAFTYFEQLTGQPLSATVARWLSGYDDHPGHVRTGGSLAVDDGESHAVLTPDPRPGSSSPTLDYR
jgi:glutathione synthase/RimK-type ligase-like ATP-grasp enzyme